MPISAASTGIATKVMGSSKPLKGGASPLRGGINAIQSHVKLLEGANNDNAEEIDRLNLRIAALEAAPGGEGESGGNKVMITLLAGGAAFKGYVPFELVE